MATLSIQIVTRDGLNPSFTAAAGGGDQFPNTGREYLEVVNNDASPTTVTVATPNTVDGQSITDRQVSVTNGQSRKIGPFPPSIYNDGNGLVQLTYSKVTSLTVGVFRVP